MEKTPNTQGFYNTEFFYAPNSVNFPDNTSLVKEEKDTYKYPVKGWTWFESIEDAYASQGKTPPPPIDNKRIKRIPPNN